MFLYLVPRGLRLIKPLVWPSETATAAPAAAPEEDEGDKEVEEEAEEREDEGVGNNGTNFREEEGWAGNGASGRMTTSRSETLLSPLLSNDVRNDSREGGDTGVATTAAAASAASTMFCTIAPWIDILMHSFIGVFAECEVTRALLRSGTIYLLQKTNSGWTI